MKIPKRLSVVPLLAAMAVILPVLLVACKTNPSPSTTPVSTIPPGLEKIEHFVFIMEENKSFDHYFGTYPGAD
jgi:phospholipase C